jgi:hypothetical protein
MSEERLTLRPVTISSEEYLRLLGRDAELSKLEAAGVDNWEGYAAAIREEDDGE